MILGKVKTMEIMKGSVVAKDLKGERGMYSYWWSTGEFYGSETVLSNARMGEYLNICQNPWNPNRNYAKYQY